MAAMALRVVVVTFWAQASRAWAGAHSFRGDCEGVAARPRPEAWQTDAASLLQVASVGGSDAATATAPQAAEQAGSADATEPGAQGAASRDEAVAGPSVLLLQQDDVRVAAGEPYVVAAVFSGRPDRECILFAYLRRLMKEGKIHEVHVHIIAKRTTKERQLKLFAMALGNEVKFKARVDWNFKAVYEYYADVYRPPPEHANNTVIVKVDDDIAYVDLAAFSDFTRFIATHRGQSVVLANTVNNGAAALRQQEAGLIPERLHGLDMTMDLPVLVPGDIEQSYGRLWHEPAMALTLHKFFLQDPKHFSFRAPDYGDCIPFPADPKMSISINFVGWQYWRSAELANLVVRAKKNWPGDPDDPGLLLAYNTSDEYAITAMNQEPKCMYTPFVVSHLSYGGQSIIDPQAVPLYVDYARRLFNNPAICSVPARARAAMLGRHPAA